MVDERAAVERMIFVVSFTVTDEWVDSYDFSLDSVNQVFDVAENVYNSKYMDIQIMLADGMSSETEIPLPQGTKVTIYVPDTIDDSRYSNHRTYHHQRSKRLLWLCDRRGLHRCIQL